MGRRALNFSLGVLDEVRSREGLTSSLVGLHQTLERALKLGVGSCPGVRECEHDAAHGCKKKSRWTVGGNEQRTPSSGRRRRPVSLPTVTHSGPSPASTMSFFTKKPQSAFGTKPSKPAAPKKATVVTKTLVKVPVKTRPGPPPPSSSAAPSSSSRPSSSATKRKPAYKKDERPPKVRRTSSVNKVQEQRVLPESDSSSDEEGGSSGRDKTPLDLTAEEYVVERPVAGPSSVSVESWEGLVSAEQIVRQNQAKYKPCEFSTSSLPLSRCGRLTGLSCAFIVHPDFKPDPDHPEPVVVTLEYPSPGAQESFLLLTPKSQGEFNPISEAVRIMQVVLKSTLGPQVASLDQLRILFQLLQTSSHPAIPSARRPARAILRRVLRRQPPLPLPTLCRLSTPSPHVRLRELQRALRRRRRPKFYVSWNDRSPQTSSRSPSSFRPSTATTLSSFAVASPATSVATLPTCRASSRTFGRC